MICESSRRRPITGFAPRPRAHTVGLMMEIDGDHSADENLMIIGCTAFFYFAERACSMGGRLCAEIH